MPIQFINAPLGSPILVYVDEQNNVAFRETKKILTAYVAAHYKYPENNNVPTSVLLAFYKDNSPNNFEYHGRIPWRDWTSPTYSFAPDIENFSGANGMWIRGVNVTPEVFLFCDIYDDQYGNGPVIANTSGKFTYIKVHETRPGDLIAWVTKHGALNYGMIRDEYSESESPGGEPLVILDIDVYCNEGKRSFPKGYPIGKDIMVLLIQRGSQQ